MLRVSQSVGLSRIPDIRQRISGIRPDTGYKKNGRISGTSLISITTFVHCKGICLLYTVYEFVSSHHHTQLVVLGEAMLQGVSLVAALVAPEVGILGMANFSLEERENNETFRLDRDAANTAGMPELAGPFFIRLRLRISDIQYTVPLPVQVYD